MRGCSSTDISFHNHVLNVMESIGARTAPHRIFQKSLFSVTFILVTISGVLDLGSHENHARIIAKLASVERYNIYYLGFEYQSLFRPTTLK